MNFKVKNETIMISELKNYLGFERKSCDHEKIYEILKNFKIS